MMSWEPSFEVKCTGTASPEAQVKFLQSLVKVKDDEIATLQLELKTRDMNLSLEKLRIERRLETLNEINQHMRERAPRSAIPIEALQWLEWRKLPWWKRLFKRVKVRKQ